MAIRVTRREKSEKPAVVAPPQVNEEVDFEQALFDSKSERVISFLANCYLEDKVIIENDSVTLLVDKAMANEPFIPVIENLRPSLVADFIEAVMQEVNKRKIVISDSDVNGKEHAPSDNPLKDKKSLNIQIL